MKRLHPFDRDMIIVMLLTVLIYYLIYRFFPMQTPTLKGY